MKEIDPLELSMRPVDLWMNQWFLLTSGTPDNYNMMTVSWGTIGCLWNKPIVQIFVRPQRFTYGFTEKHESFTLCSFPNQYKKALNILGTISGRDGDKLSKTNLTVKPSTKISAPSYAEASLILECRKIYKQNMDPQGFQDSSIQNHYPENDFHVIYFGEILAALRKE